MKKAFISYSWDSPEHQQSVLELSNRLRSDGIDCDIDLYYQSPKEGWPRWMERLTRESDYVLVVCTESYLEGYEGGRPPKVGQGVKWESLLTSNDIYYNDSENNKYIPAIGPVIIKAKTVIVTPSSSANLNLISLILTA